MNVLHVSSVVWNTTSNMKKDKAQFPEEMKRKCVSTFQEQLELAEKLSKETEIGIKNNGWRKKMGQLSLNKHICLGEQCIDSATYLEYSLECKMNKYCCNNKITCAL